MSFNKTLELCGMQRELDDRIITEKEIVISPAQRFNNTMVALMVELAEFANEGRWFKIWSENQKPNTELYSWIEDGHIIETANDPRENPHPGKFYNGFSVKNPLLEEYVDGIHFFLSLANQTEWYNSLEFDEEFLSGRLVYKTFNNYNSLYLDLVLQLALTTSTKNQASFERAWRSYLILGMSGFGFTFDDIYTAYKAKNAKNHVRQDTGY